MAVATDERVAEFIRDHGAIRLGCAGGCLRDDCDGIREIPPGWTDITEHQSLKDALSTYDDPGDPEPPKGYSVLDWETHFGICPDCQDVDRPVVVNFGL